jgi:hypothetical protein
MLNLDFGKIYANFMKLDVEKRKVQNVGQDNLEKAKNITWDKMSV